MSLMPASTLNTGDIVRVAGKRTLSVVVRSERIVSEDRLRGDSYRVDEFDIVKLDVLATGGSLVDPKITGYYFTDGDMRGKGVGINRGQLQVLGSTKVRAKVSIEYVFGAVKMY